MTEHDAISRALERHLRRHSPRSAPVALRGGVNNTNTVWKENVRLSEKGRQISPILQPARSCCAIPRQLLSWKDAHVSL